MGESKIVLTFLLFEVYDYQRVKKPNIKTDSSMFFNSRMSVFLNKKNIGIKFVYGNYLSFHS